MSSASSSVDGSSHTESSHREEEETDSGDDNNHRQPKKKNKKENKKRSRELTPKQNVTAVPAAAVNMKTSDEADAEDRSGRPDAKMWMHVTRTVADLCDEARQTRLPNPSLLARLIPAAQELEKVCRVIWSKQSGREMTSRHSHHDFHRLFPGLRDVTFSISTSATGCGKRVTFGDVDADQQQQQQAFDDDDDEDDDDEDDEDEEQDDDDAAARKRQRHH